MASVGGMDEGTEFEFDLDRSTDEAWAQFSQRLAEVISVIDDGGELTIGTLSSRREPAPYVRFRQFVADSRPTICAEASGNASLGEAFQLSADQLDELAELGWQPPQVAGPHPSANFWVRRDQDDSGELADLAVATLRQVFGVEHPVFLAPDQLAEILQPDSEAVHETLERNAATVPAVQPVDRHHLDDLVSDELARLFGHPPFRDEEGDYAIRVGSTMVFVRITPDADELLLFSVLVHDVEGRSRAMEVLNDINVQSRYGRFALHQDRVLVTMSLMTRPFVASHLAQGVRIMSRLADGIDDELARKLRGRTTFGEGE